MTQASNLKIVFLSIFFFNIIQNLNSQSLSNRYNNLGEIIVSHLPSAPFPHAKRMNGYTYNDSFYSSEEHYSDSTIVIFIPKGFLAKGKNDFVIHFHGWNNNVDSVLSQFKLIEQFCESDKNAILIIPQGPKNAPDSFGGKLEDENGFSNLINEITELLYQKGIIKHKTVGNIVLSGHSGGYRVISYILMRGGLTKNIREVYLFDGLYGQIEKYTYWIDHYNGKFINIYTKDGGTKDQSENLMECFDSWQISYLFKNEVEFSEKDLKNTNNIFIYSDLGHNEVISLRSQLLRFLKASCLDEL